MMIRNFKTADADRCHEIYSHYVENTTVTFEEQIPVPKEFEKRLNRIAEKDPFLVATEDHKIIGYAYLDLFNERSAYRYTADLSIYLDKDHCSKKIGSLLFHELEKQAKQSGIKNIISIITAQNQISLRFHEKNGFHCVGTLKNVGYKFNQWLSVSYYQKYIGSDPESSQSV